MLKKNDKMNMEEVEEIQNKIKKELKEVKDRYKNDGKVHESFK